jgi:hypothetical protein
MRADGRVLSEYERIRPCVQRTPRRGACSSSQIGGISLWMAIMYMLLYRVGKEIGSSGAIDPLMARLIPNALFPRRWPAL